GGELEQHAYLGPWSEFLEKLANMALPEKWSFKDAAEGDYTILRQYIKFTFHHLQNDDKVPENADHTFCAFNTGLVDRHYDDIYACFTRNPLPGKQDWLFTDFCIAGRRGLGKELINAFKEPPSVASYFTEKDELLFNVDCNRFYDYQHMIVDNIDRLPLDFLAEELGGNKEASALVHELTETPPQSRGPIYEKLKDLLDEEERLYNRLKNRFNDAIDLAIKRVRWNYKTAIPCYYPTTGKMCFMLPLALVDDNRTDVALVMEKKDSGSYQGQTILTLQAAYIDARLICRPDSDWLRTNEIRVTDDNGDDLVSED
ncbi:MAG: DUF3825 domain-containing protein, partial [Clostridia bacterium]|nr:DUF3825 domain-containing protein [Clostridia bacterium]